MVGRWIEWMDSPEVKDAFALIESLLSTLASLLEVQVAGRFLPWTVAHTRALEGGEPETRLTFDGEPDVQKTFECHAWPFAHLDGKWNAARGDPALRAMLEKTACAGHLP